MKILRAIGLILLGYMFSVHTQGILLLQIWILACFGFRVWQERYNS